MKPGVKDVIMVSEPALVAIATIEKPRLRNQKIVIMNAGHDAADLYFIEMPSRLSFKLFAINYFDSETVSF